MAKKVVDFMFRPASTLSRTTSPVYTTSLLAEALVAIVPFFASHCFCFFCHGKDGIVLLPPAPWSDKIQIFDGVINIISINVCNFSLHSAAGNI